MLTNSVRGICLLIFLLMLAAGCSQGGGGDGSLNSNPASSAPKNSSNSPDSETSQLEVPPEPAEVNIYFSYNMQFEEIGLKEAVEKQFPHYTLNLIVRGEGLQYEDVIISQTPIDLVYESTAFTVARIQHYGLDQDLQHWIDKYDFDLSVFEPNILAHSYASNSEGVLYGLPFSLNRYGLFYNQDIFDMFAVSYPEDGMTWDEAYDLARNLTRLHEGEQYIGFTVHPNNIMLNNQLSLGPLDLKENKAAVNTDQWKMLYENIGRFFKLSDAGIVPTSEAGNGRLAMVLDPVGFSGNPESAINWDVVSVPMLKERPNTGLKPASLSFFLSKISQNKDAAFQVMAYLVSEEIQTMMTRQRAQGTPLVSTAVKESFGQDLPQWQGKNVGALYYFPDAPPQEPRDPGLVDVSVDFSAPMREYVLEGKDINTVLREFEEKINQDIAVKMAEMAD